MANNNFTPSLGNYTPLQPFRYWCQKVLPLVYDDSLSYYELLCKVVDYLNKTMEDVETLHGDVTNLHDAYIKLQTYVNNYFSDLNIQEEINKKLDQMVEDGTLSDIINNVILKELNEKVDSMYSVYENYKKSNIINIMELGAKNDGSEDISEIFNANTARGDIFFPAGVYKISNTLQCVNGIIGCGGTAHRSKDGATVLLSDVNNVAISASNIGYHATFRGFMLKLNGTEIAGINSESITKNNHLRLFDVTITNVANNGIRIRNRYTSSRYLVCDNVHIWGTDVISDNSIGLNLATCDDSVLLNMNILGCKCGIYTESLLLIDNVHIWCGRILGEQTMEWHNKTIGIETKALINAGKLYTDTCKTHILFSGDVKFVRIDNYMCINEPNFPQFNVCNTSLSGSIVCDLLTLSIYDESNIQEGIDYQDGTFYTYSDYVPKNNHFPILKQNETIYTTKNKVCEISRLWARYGGYAAVIISDDAGNVVKLENTVVNLKKTAINGDIDLYYELNEYNYVIYALPTTANRFTITPIASSFGNTYFNSLTRFKPLKKNYKPSVRDDSSGLTKLN